MPATDERMQAGVALDINGTCCESGYLDNCGVCDGSDNCAVLALVAVSMTYDAYYSTYPNITAGVQAALQSQQGLGIPTDALTLHDMWWMVDMFGNYHIDYSNGNLMISKVRLHGTAV